MTLLDLLTPYWLPTLLELSSAVTVIGLLVNQILLRRTLEKRMILWCAKYCDARFRLKSISHDLLQEDLSALTKRLDLLDKPSNDRAIKEDFVTLNNRVHDLEEAHNLNTMNKIAGILNKKKKNTKKPISKAPIATSKPRRKANGVGIHAR